jgi:orotate phosphoribosyltransferase
MMDIRALLHETGCVLEGEHFFALKKKGLVSKKYINIDPLFTQPEILERIVSDLIFPFAGSFNCLVGPATGGIPLVYAATYSAKASGIDVQSTAFGEKDEAKFTFQRMGFAKAVHGKNVLVLEDISSTGESSGGVASLVNEVGGNLIGASLIWNRGNVTAEQIRVPRLHALVTETVTTWRVEDKPPGWGTLPLVGDIGHPEYYSDYPGERLKLLV